MTEPSIGQRIERTPLAQVVIAVLIVAALLAQLATHLPEGSAVEGEIGESADYLVRLGGLESEWGVFAPTPRTTSVGVEARVTFEDGTYAIWHLPEGSRVGGNFRYYRWRKWLERVRADGFRILWEPSCQWIASLYDEFDSPVERVQLVRRSRENQIVGEQPPYEEFVYHACTPDEAHS